MQSLVSPIQPLGRSHKMQRTQVLLTKVEQSATLSIPRGGGDFNQIAASLEASWGMAYSYSTDELKAMWADAIASGTLLALHNDPDLANNVPIDGCPISAGGYSEQKNSQSNISINSTVNGRR